MQEQKLSLKYTEVEQQGLEEESNCLSLRQELFPTQNQSWESSCFFQK